MPDRPDFAAFVDAVGERLEKGALTYGDRSFDRPSVGLACEIEEELLDVCAWAFILWTRLRRLRDGLALAERAGP
jgi:hypothetical protein